jgi:hypothetical protein
LDDDLRGKESPDAVFEYHGVWDKKDGTCFDSSSSIFCLDWYGFSFYLKEIFFVMDLGDVGILIILNSLIIISIHKP